MACHSKLPAILRSASYEGQARKRRMVAEELNGGSEVFGGHAVEAAVGREESVIRGGPWISMLTLKTKDRGGLWRGGREELGGQEGDHGPGWVLASGSFEGDGEVGGKCRVNRMERSDMDRTERDVPRRWTAGGWDQSSEQPEPIPVAGGSSLQPLLPPVRMPHLMRYGNDVHRLHLVDDFKNDPVRECLAEHPPVWTLDDSKEQRYFPGFPDSIVNLIEKPLHKLGIDFTIPLRGIGHFSGYLGVG